MKWNELVWNVFLTKFGIANSFALSVLVYCRRRKSEHPLIFCNRSRRLATWRARTCHTMFVLSFPFSYLKIQLYVDPFCHVDFWMVIFSLLLMHHRPLTWNNVLKSSLGTLESSWAPDTSWYIGFDVVFYWLPMILHAVCFSLILMMRSILIHLGSCLPSLSEDKAALNACLLMLSTAASSRQASRG